MSNTLSTEIANKVTEQLINEIGDKNSTIMQEIKELVASIDSAKNEIASIQPSDLAEKDIPNAADFLDTISQTSREACTNILNCAEDLMVLSDEIPEDYKKSLINISTRLFEASNFDDLNGQRIQKVIKTLRHTEEHLKSLLTTYDKTNPCPEEKSLMNGPQDKKDAITQDEVDKILDSS